MHSRREMANQNGRAHPSRNAHLAGFHRDEDRNEGRDRDRIGAMRDDDRALGDRYEPGQSWRPDDRLERDDRSPDRRFDRGPDRSFEQRFDRAFDRAFDRSFDRSSDRSSDDRLDEQADRRRWGRRSERFSESDRVWEPYGARDREDRGETGRPDLRVDIRGSREATPRQDQLLRGAYRDHDESSRDLSYRAGPPHAEPYGSHGQHEASHEASTERTQDSRSGAGPARGRMAQARGPHSGKGPVGFQRSDDRIRELVCEALTDDGEVDASHIEVTVKGGEVTLTGAIEDRRMKRLAEDCVEAVPGVKDVHNQLRIGPPAMAADRSGHGADRTEKPTADKHERHAEPSDKKHRPS